MLKFAHASSESRPIIHSAFCWMRSSNRSVVTEALIQYSEVYSITLRIWALYTVALPQASSLDAILLRAPSLCPALEEMFICFFNVNLLSTVTPRISRSSTSVIMALPKYGSIFVGFLFS